MNEPVTTSSQTILQTVERYYADRLEQFGPTPRGVDWNSSESQALRFERLLEIVHGEPLEVSPKATAPSVNDAPRSLLDVGCGYGALLDYVRGRGLTLDYRGFDISAAMIQAAQARHASMPGCDFTTDADALQPATYAVASGIFNVRLGHPVERWREYVAETLRLLDRLAGRGFAFNMLSMYSDPERRRDDLYYADPREMFDVCKRQFSARVALLHDYPLYEFTIIVRK